MRINALLYSILTAFSLAPAHAQERAPIEHNLQLQQQQSDAFALRRQQQSMDVDPALRAEQRRRQDALHARQLRRLDSGRVVPDTPAQQAARRAEQMRMEQERELLLEEAAREAQEN